MRSRTQGSTSQPLDERLEESDWPHRREQIARWVAIGDTSLLQDLTPEQRAEVLTQVAAIRRDRLLRHIARDCGGHVEPGRSPSAADVHRNFLSD